MAKQLRIADVFCGIGSFHIAAESLDMKCVWACDNDVHVQKVYQAHFGVVPSGDIQQVDPVTVPEHDILCAGFPCQPFSRMGNKRGTNEERGRVMDYAIDILRVKRPRAFILENVRGLLSSNNGADFERLKAMVRDAGYSFQDQLLKCEDFGIPQTRHRIFMVGFRDGKPAGFQYPRPVGKCPTLSEFLGIDVVKSFSNTVRCSGRKSGVDNAKNWSAYRLRDGSVIEYNLEQVTKLQGFPDDFEWGDVPDSQRWKMLGNTIPTCLSRAILDAVGKHLQSFPEEPAQDLPAATAPLIAPHPPPARKIIEDRLEERSRMVAERKRTRAAKVAKNEDFEEDEVKEASEDCEMPDQEEEEEEDEMPAKKSRQQQGAVATSVAAATQPVPAITVAQVSTAITQAVTQPAATAIAAASMTQSQVALHITVKSGSEFTFSLPSGVKEQVVVLKITG